MAAPVPRRARGTIDPRRVPTGAPTRECMVCGTRFCLPVDANGQYSRRRTCSEYCLRIVQSNTFERLHERAQSDPTLAAKLYTRDFAAMGRAGGKVSKGKTGWKEPASITRYRIGRKMASERSRAEQGRVERATQ